MQPSSNEPAPRIAPQPTAALNKRPSLLLPIIFVISAAFAILTLVILDRLDNCFWQHLCGPLLAEDSSQGRLDTALPAPQGGLVLEQTFAARRDGLAEVELILVRYGGDSAEAPQDSSFTVELRDGSGEWIAAETLSTAGLNHNQTYVLTFAPQAHSAGQTYTLRLIGSETNHMAAWGYSLDVYSSGSLSVVAGPLVENVPQTAARELRFVTRYALTAGDALASALAPLEAWRLWLVTLLFLPLPGVLLLLLVGIRGWDAAAWWGAALALGVATWPVLWYWVSLAGGRWSGAVLWVVVAVGWAAAGGLVVRRRQMAKRMDSEVMPRRRFRNVPVHALLAILLMVTLSSRFIAIREQAYPPWVDSSRHALITAVMVENGNTPEGYEPYLPIDHFPYHFGFHTLSASLILMTGQPLPGLLLYLMQLLGGLVPLPVYAAGWMVTRRRAVGLLSAFLVSLPFFFPGYYATWGRMTQLAAMVVMPVLLALTWRMGRGWPRVWPLVSVMAAGVFLIHFRVFLFYLPFIVLVAVAHLIRYQRWRGLVMAGTVGTLLVSPRIASLLVVAQPLQTFQQSLAGYNDFPTGYITTGWERAYLVLAAVAVVIVTIGTIFRRRWVTFPLILILWVGALFALLAGERLGLPETLVVNLNSMYITLFLPLSLLLSIVTVRVGEWMLKGGRKPATIDFWPLARGLAALLAGFALGLLILFGWRQQINILNQQTILAVPEDAPALDWIAANLPDESRIAVSAWQWLGVTWAGSDGGAWIVPLTGLEATTPPVDHIYNRDLFADVRAFNDAATVVEDWGEPSAVAWLKDQGVTHVFAGQRGGFFDPAELNRNPFLEKVYQNEGAFVFAVK